MPESNQSFTIDFNCDMGEGIGHDAALMPYISSANIACSFHAGDEASMNETVRLAIQHHVAIGVHPSFRDKENFGRKEMNLSSEEIYSIVTEQIKILADIVKVQGSVLNHVKPHGALYNMAAKNAEMAKAIALAIRDYDSNLVLYGLSGSYSISEAVKAGLKTASEVFADRTYRDDGSLTPRSEANALIKNPDQAMAQILQMITEKNVTTVSEKKILVIADTICLHSDGKDAVEFAKQIYDMLQKENIQILATRK